MDATIIRQVPLFEGLDEATLGELYQKMSEVTLRRGEVLFEENDDADQLYIVTEGKVKLGHTTSDGRENLLAILGPGEILGELTLFDRGTRSGTATAISSTRLLSLAHTDLMAFIDSHPQMAKLMLRDLAGRLRRTNEALADMVFSDVPGRVAKAEELAQLVGASRETVNKSLAEFGSRGWIRLEGRAVMLLDLERLVRRAR